MLVCRVCLKPTEKCYRLYALQDRVQLGETLKLCVPELDLSISKRPVICDPCMKILNTAYYFRKICMQTENYINEYVTKSNKKGSFVELSVVVQSLFNGNGPPPFQYENLQCQPVLDNELSQSGCQNSESSAACDEDHPDSNVPGVPLIPCGGAVPANPICLPKAPTAIDNMQSTPIILNSPTMFTQNEVLYEPSKLNVFSTSTDASSSATPAPSKGVKIKSVEKINETAIVDIEAQVPGIIGANKTSSTDPTAAPPVVMISNAIDTDIVRDPLEITDLTQSQAGSVNQADVSSSLKICEDIVVLDDDDDDVQVIEPSKGEDRLNNLLRSTPAIENNDVPELVSITRVDPLNQNRNQRRQTIEIPRIVPDKASNSQDKANEPKPIKVVNPKTNQVQIIGYVLSPGSKDRPPITHNRSNSRYTVSHVQQKTPTPDASKVPVVPDIAVPPLTVITRSAAKAKDTTRKSTESPGKIEIVGKSNTETARDSFFTGLKLKQTDSPTHSVDNQDKHENKAAADPLGEEKEDDPEYVSLQDIEKLAAGKDSGKEFEEVNVKEENVSDDEGSASRPERVKRGRTDDVDKHSEEDSPPKPKKMRSGSQRGSAVGGTDDKLNLLPVVELEPLDKAKHPVADPLGVEVKEEISNDTQHDSLASIVDTFKSVTGQDADQDVSNPLSQVPEREGVQVPDFDEIAGRDGEEAQDGIIPAKRQRRPPKRLRYNSGEENSQESSQKQKKRGRPRKKPALEPVPPAPVEEATPKRKGRPRKNEPDPTLVVAKIMKQAGLYHFLTGEEGTERKKRGRKKKETKPADGEGMGLFHSLFGNIADMHNESSDNVDNNKSYEQGQSEAGDTTMYNSSNFENDSSVYGEASQEFVEEPSQFVSHSEASAEATYVMAEPELEISNTEVPGPQKTTDSMTNRESAVTTLIENENQDTIHSKGANDDSEHPVHELSDSASSQGGSDPINDEEPNDDPVQETNDSVTNQGDTTHSKGVNDDIEQPVQELSDSASSHGESDPLHNEEANDSVTNLADTIHSKGAEDDMDHPVQELSDSASSHGESDPLNDEADDSVTNQGDAMHSKQANDDVDHHVQELSDSASIQGESDPLNDDGDNPIQESNDSVTNQSDSGSDKDDSESMDQNCMDTDDADPKRTFDSTTAHESEAYDTDESADNSVASADQHVNDHPEESSESLIHMSDFENSLSGDNVEIVEEEDAPEFVDPDMC